MFLPCVRAALRASSNVRRTRSICCALSGGVSLGHGATTDMRPPSSSDMPIPIRTASRSAGMSSGTAAVSRTCSAAPATAASACRRAVSSSAKTSSSSSTGSVPSDRNSSYAASRSDNAIDHDSPCDAKPFAG